MKKRCIIFIAIIASLLLILAFWVIASLSGGSGEELAPQTLTLTGSDGAIEVVADPKASLNDEGTAVLYTSENLQLEITVADPEEAADNASGVRGTTKEGNAFVAKDEAVYVKVGTETVKAKVVGNSAGKDAGKIAGVVSALTRKQTGYQKGVDDYNHNYSVYYIEPADCLLYYPSQLTILETYEDNSLLIKDTRSDATLRVTLGENPYSSMNELEGFIKKSEYSLVLAIGNDWYTAEKSGKSKKTFTYAGLGENYIVNAELSYAESDSFVFEELRKLIKCRFIGDGIWVSEAFEPEYKSGVLKDKYKDGQRGDFGMTSYYSAADGCYLYYPNVFTVVTPGTDDGTWFADPATGAYILLYTYNDAGETSLRELVEQSPYEKADIEGAYSVRFSDKTYYGNESFERVIAYRDGTLYYADFFYPSEYEKTYGPMTGLISVILPGEEVGNTEMQTIYYPAYGCAVTIPAQFYERNASGDQIAFVDGMTGLEMTLTFSELADKSEGDNLFGYFDCKAPDENIVLGEDWLKWHDNGGLRIGSVGERFGALLFLPYPNAYTAYADSFDRFAVCFIGDETSRGEADEIREYADSANGSDRGDMTDASEVDTSAPDTTSDTAPDTTPAKATPAETEPAEPKEKIYSYEDLPIDEIWELGEPSDDYPKISGDINILVFENLTDEVFEALDNLLDVLNALDFTITDYYENDEYGIYSYDLEGYLPDTGEFVYMTFDINENGAEDWRIVLTYVFKLPVGEVREGGLLWDEDDRSSDESRMLAVSTVLHGGMEILWEYLEDSSKDPDGYVYMFGTMKVNAGELNGDYSDDYDITMPCFSYGTYNKNGVYVPAQSFVYEVVSGFLYRVDNSGNLIMVGF